jgi:hypothetical protein
MTGRVSEEAKWPVADGVGAETLERKFKVR